MDERPDGERYDEFFSEIPYTVFGSAWVDDFENLTRWHAPFVSTRAIPFTKLVQTVERYLACIDDYTSVLNEDAIRAFDKASALAGRPTS